MNMLIKCLCNLYFKQRIGNLEFNSICNIDFKQFSNSFHVGVGRVLGSGEYIGKWHVIKMI